MMDVRMPDGTVIRGVPEGTTQDEVLRRYQSAAQARSSDDGWPSADPLEGMTGFQKFAAGMGKRMMDIGTLGLREVPESDRALMQTGAGMAGGAAVDIGALLAGGAGLRAAGTAAKAAGKAPQIAAWAQRLGQSMVAPKNITDAASAGLYYGALTTPGDLGDRATAAATGAVGGAAGQAIGQGLVAGGRALGNAFSPNAKVVEGLTRHSGLSADDLAAAIRAGNQTIVEGSRPTTAQAAMNPGLSQLERTLHNRNPIPFTLAREAQDEARRQAMAKIGAPIGENAREVAEDVGKLIARRAAPQRTAWQVDREAAYQAIDPDMQSRIAAPVKQVNEIMADIFSPGAGKPTAELSSLVGDLKTLSKQTDDLIEKARVAKGVISTDKHSLGDAIRIWGGLNVKQGGGEVRWLKESELGKRSALGSFASNKGRLSLARATEKAHELGYLPEEDINLLLDKLAEEAGGTPVFSARMGEDILARRAGMPEAPDEAAVLPWRALENLRARANAIVRNPALSQTVDQKAAIKIRDALDAEMERAASGASPVWGENFPPDMIDRAQAARRLHAEGKQRFDTGPSRDMLRYGADGLPRSQGAEVTRGFINASDSQVADAQQFMRMVGDDKGSIEAARRYALADLMQFAGSERSLSPSKFKGWVDSRKPMLDVLFPEDQAKQILAVRNDLLRAKEAGNLGRAVGSNTAQNLEGSNALSRAIGVGALSRLPVVGRYAGALESAAREAERARLTELLTPAMVSPDLALDAIMRQRFGLLGTAADRLPQRLGLFGVPSAMAIPGLLSVNTGQ